MDNFPTRDFLTGTVINKPEWMTPLNVNSLIEALATPAAQRDEIHQQWIQFLQGCYNPPIPSDHIEQLIYYIPFSLLSITTGFDADSIDDYPKAGQLSADENSRAQSYAQLLARIGADGDGVEMSFTTENHQPETHPSESNHGLNTPLHTLSLSSPSHSLNQHNSLESQIEQTRKSWNQVVAPALSDVTKQSNLSNMDSVSFCPPQHIIQPESQNADDNADDDSASVGKSRNRLKKLTSGNKISKDKEKFGKKTKTVKFIKDALDTTPNHTPTYLEDNTISPTNQTIPEETLPTHPNPSINNNNNQTPYSPTQTMTHVTDDNTDVNPGLLKRAWALTMDDVDAPSNNDPHGHINSDNINLTSNPAFQNQTNMTFIIANGRQIHSNTPSRVDELTHAPLDPSTMESSHTPTSSTRRWAIAGNEPLRTLFKEAADSLKLTYRPVQNYPEWEAVSNFNVDTSKVTGLIYPLMRNAKRGYSVFISHARGMMGESELLFMNQKTRHVKATYTSLIPGCITALMPPALINELKINNIFNHGPVTFCEFLVKHEATLFGLNELQIDSDAAAQQCSATSMISWLVGLQRQLVIHHLSGVFSGTKQSANSVKLAELITLIMDSDDDEARNECFREFIDLIECKDLSPEETADFKSMLLSYFTERRHVLKYSTALRMRHSGYLCFPICARDRTFYCSECKVEFHDLKVHIHTKTHVQLLNAKYAKHHQEKPICLICGDPYRGEVCNTPTHRAVVSRSFSEMLSLFQEYNVDEVDQLTTEMDKLFSKTPSAQKSAVRKSQPQKTSQSTTSAAVSDGADQLMADADFPTLAAATSYANTVMKSSTPSDARAPPDHQTQTSSLSAVVQKLDASYATSSKPRSSKSIKSNHTTATARGRAIQNRSNTKAYSAESKFSQVYLALSSHGTVDLSADLALVYNWQKVTSNGRTHEVCFPTLSDPWLAASFGTLILKLGYFKSGVTKSYASFDHNRQHYVPTTPNPSDHQRICQLFGVDVSTAPAFSTYILSMFKTATIDIFPRIEADIVDFFLIKRNPLHITVNPLYDLFTPNAPLLADNTLRTIANNNMTFQELKTHLAATHQWVLLNYLSRKVFLSKNIPDMSRIFHFKLEQKVPPSLFARRPPTSHVPIVD
jgi:hypothetical protein